MDNDEYHNITRSLVAIMANQNRINDDIRTAITELTQLFREHQTHLVRLDTVIEDIKTLLARNIPLSENGRDV